MEARAEHRWGLALAGLAVFIFSVVALSGPGRIEIVDGETRYDVARSLVEHGDPAIRDPNAWFAVFPGREGKLYTTYRLGQSLAGVPAILAADLTGSGSEGRRHFFFALIGAVACGSLALCYAAWFRHRGQAPRQALLWAAGGVLCTPAWFYGASTFDDVLGAAAVVLAIVLAMASRGWRRAALGAAGAGLALGIAFNCKQPLGIYLLPVVAAWHDPRRPFREQAAGLAWILAGLTLGLGVYFGYRFYCFPPGTMEANAALTAKYGPIWSPHAATNLLALLFSAGASALLYCPPLALGAVGARSWWRTDRWFCGALLAASGVFTCVIASLTFFKGDPSWGPRYLTPVFSALWLMAPAGARLMRKRTATALLVAGAAVQVLALTVDPSRLYVERQLHISSGRASAAVYFDPRFSHLLNRPREILEIARGGSGPAARVSWPVVDSVSRGSEAVVRQRAFQMPNTFRPWWTAGLPVGVDRGRTAVLLILVAAASSVIMYWSTGGRRSPAATTSGSTPPV